MQHRRPLNNNPAMVASDEMKELRQQVDKLRERLDFMAPMLSLLTFTQDYFQRVECEASVQLMRLKNARLADSAAVDGSSEKEKMDPNSVETARWLHTMTDLMIGLGGYCQARASSAPSATEALPETRPSPTSSPRDEGLLPEEGPLHERRNNNSSSSGHRRGAAHFGGKGLPASRTSFAERPLLAFEGLRSSGGRALSPNKTDLGSGRAPLGHSQPSLTLKRGPQAGTGQGRSLGGASLESTLEFGGLALGRGTWANAYRQATGMRRDALRLLCTSGIVTERELADDLTVISEEHIDECVSIAVEMLQRWPSEHGTPPQQEAKRFFEERLAALYMKRAPAPFGLT
mmetsp:Transcript_39871/g.119326  ORF Transcript_39871/g.119326 Transcript_39871/m.119326 type:complete len:346 (-) Transcript_39871:119-1156(-)